MALFFCGNEEAMKYEPKTIYCPRCGRRVGQWDGKSTINVIVLKCRRCWKRVVYYIDSDETKLEPVPTRNCSSGMTFNY